MSANRGVLASKTLEIITAFRIAQTQQARECNMTRSPTFRSNLPQVTATAADLQPPITRTKVDAETVQKQLQSVMCLVSIAPHLCRFPRALPVAIGIYPAADYVFLPLHRQ